MRWGAGGGRGSPAASAGTQVQGILEAAQATAEAIERDAAQEAQRARDAANADAARTREEAIAQARAHVGTVSKATESLLERVGSMDGETRTLIDSLHTGASRLTGDLAAVETNMAALYDAAAGRTGEAAGVAEDGHADGYESAGVAPAAIPVPTAEPHSEPFVETLEESHEGMQGDPYEEALEPHIEAHQGAQPEFEPDEEPPFSQQEHVEPAPSGAQGDLDGARLVALNMALNGDSREETGRYLAENFNVADSDRLLDEVYAAIEG